MTDIQFRSDMTVELVDHMGDDMSIVRAARVSTGKDTDPTSTEQCAGLINFLMKNRHGTPFEHNAMTFRIEAPIFVWREFMRHRIGFSYNEESGRYKRLDPVFYVPAADRNLVQVGKAGQYTFEPGDADLHGHVSDALESCASIAYRSYEGMLSDGVAREVARMCLPVNIYSSAYVTCNARSLMAFLSLRTKDPIAKFPSFPQREIEMVAEMMEADFARLFPITMRAFDDAGRVAP